jgi:hypothetical protein
MSIPVGNLIWTEDDVFDTLYENGIETSEENIEKAVKAIEKDNEYIMQFVNEAINGIIFDEFRHHFIK